jgi:hypothetical protein
VRRFLRKSLPFVAVLGVATAPWGWMSASADEHRPETAGTPERPGGPPAPGEAGHSHENPRNTEEARRYFNPSNDPNIHVRDNGDGRWKITYQTPKKAE